MLNKNKSFAISFFFFALVIFLAQTSFVFRAQATGALTSLSDTLSLEAASTAADQTILFKLRNGLTASNVIDLVFDTDTVVPDSLLYTDVDIATASAGSTTACASGSLTYVENTLDVGAGTPSTNAHWAIRLPGATSGGTGLHDTLRLVSDSDGSATLAAYTCLRVKVGTNATSGVGSASANTQIINGTGDSVLTITTPFDTGLIQIPILTVGGASGVVISATVPAGSTTVVVPTPDTGSVTPISSTSATISGSISDDGGGSITEYGFLGTFPGGSVVFTSAVPAIPPTFTYTTTLTGLTCGVPYDYYSYAKNSAGQDDGTTFSFTLSCPVAPPPPVTSPGGGPAITTTTVNFSGTAYPGARVVVLEDGKAIAVVTAGNDGKFVATTAGIASGSYVFSLYAKDHKGRLSAAYSLPFSINSKSIVNIGGLLLSPTIDVDRSTVKQGDAVTVTGESAPGSTVKISLGGALQKTYSTVVGASGLYSLSIPTTSLVSGLYSVTAKALLGTDTSPSTRPVSFHVGSVTAEKIVGCGTEGSDVNCDDRVDIVDFSILKSWYKKSNPPARVDLNFDGVIDLKDFSILASHWTG